MPPHTKCFSATWLLEFAREEEVLVSLLERKSNVVKNDRIWILNSEKSK